VLEELVAFVASDAFEEALLGLVLPGLLLHHHFDVLPSGPLVDNIIVEVVL